MDISLLVYCTVGTRSLDNALQAIVRILSKQSVMGSSIIYAYRGSFCDITPPQLMKLGLALEATKRPYLSCCVYPV
ncbi:hypothetical protein MTR_5g033000 [Medicago truncatula]|uniref:Uncharacterized protein n=1 Tax=Medicago truncatula TaxID=3880 RepID=G7JYW8_MEDTR|nr:hypothetical protein MTR_5g033000 [Medicago truncatula]